MGILDAALHVGKETTYGTAVALTRSFEAQADEWKREQQRIESVGFRAAMQTVRTDRVSTINMGGTGKVTLDVLSKGFGLLAQGFLGSTTNPVQQGVTSAYKSTFASNSDGPSVSFTMQQVRPFASTDSDDEFTHKGCVVTGWKLSCEPGGLLKAEIDYDFQDVATDVAEGTPTYPAGAVPFDWGMCSATVDAGAVDVRKFELTADLGLKTDRRYLRGSVLKKQPVTAAVPSYTGMLELDFDDTTRYAEWLVGGDQALVVTFQGALIETTYYNTVKVTIPAAQWTGDSPKVSLSELPVQPLPFKALHDGTNAAVTIEYTSTDTTL